MSSNVALFPNRLPRLDFEKNISASVKGLFACIQADSVRCQVVQIPDLAAGVLCGFS